MKYDRGQPFSTKWMLASMAIFIGIELLLGGIVGQIVVGRFMSLSLRFMLQGLLNVVSFFIGGFIIGVISPGLRVREPATGAFLSVALMLILSIFTPYSFIRFSLTKMIIGGVVAFCLALTGAKIGEKVTGHHIPD
jgi:hypothetical protein